VPMISPELALVDPELARAARETLYEPGQFVPAWREVVPPLPRLVDPTPVALPLPVVLPGVRNEPRRRRAAALAAGAGLVVFGLVAGLQEHVRHASATDVGSAAALQARAHRQTGTARRYVWPTVPGASSYWVELRKGGALIYAAAAKSPTTALPAGLALSPGRYHWTVTPILADREARPVVEETFVVNAS